MRYYLGADLGATKTHTLIVDETGRALGFGESGPGNHESVGYDGMFQSMQAGMEQALHAAGLKKEDITGACFGVAGYDWTCLLYTSPSPRDRSVSRMPSSA